MSQIIDRRLNGKNKSAVNRTKFVKRFKAQIKKAVDDAINKRNVTDIDQGGVVNIPARDISEPVFHHGPGGKRSIVHPGNKEFITGDQVPRPPQGQGGAGGKASNSGEGEDDFKFNLSREEFLEYLFEDCALPRLVKTQLNAVAEFTRVRGGYTTTGSPSNLNLIQTRKRGIGRGIAFGKLSKKKRIEELEAELEKLKKDPEDNSILIAEIEGEIRFLQKKIKSIPFIDPFDERYNSRVKVPKPTTQAVMFCLMDVSGSMDQMKKDLAKRFFMLMYLFLKRTYEKIEVVFIRHHTIASEVSEEEFFYARETGGTVVSSALKLTQEIIRDRFPTSDWNLYATQASDGDNWDDDSPLCRDLLLNSLLPCLQYFAYVEIAAEEHQNLWKAYEEVLKAQGENSHFAMGDVKTAGDIFAVFKALFKKTRG